MSQLPEFSQATPEEGGWFVFEEADHVIRVWISVISGKEKIYVDDQLIHESRSFQRENTHEFQLKNQHYTVKIHTVSMLQGEMTCALFRNGEKVKAYQLTILRERQDFGRNLAIFAIIGVILGVSVAVFELEEWLAYIVAGIVLIYLMVKSMTMRLVVKEIE